MPKTRTTTVSQNDNGQYQVTIPKALGDFFELDGKQLEWKSGSAANKIEIVIQNE